MVSALTQASGREFHSGTVLTKNECLYWAVCERICLNLKLWWCLVLGSAGSKIASACTGMLHLTIVKSTASRISRLRSLRGAQFRSFSNDETLVKRLWSCMTNLAARRWMPSRMLMSLIRYASHTAAQYSSLDLMSEMYACSRNFCGHFDKFLFKRPRVELDLAAMLRRWYPHWRSSLRFIH